MMTVSETTNNKKALELSELISRLQDLSPLPPNQELQRWLLATENKVEEAETMYRKSHSWRKQKGVDFILRWKPPEVLRKYYPGGFAGFDSAGCPVWIIPFGNADMKGMLSCVSKEEFLDFSLRIIESSLLMMRQRSITCPNQPPVYQHVFIFDLEGFTVKDATYGPLLDILHRLITLYEANYPETLKAAYVLNASAVFQLVFRIIKRAVQQKTLGKIYVFGNNDWRKALLEAVPGDILPSKWGGSYKTVDGAQPTGICMGGEVPLYYQSVHQPQEIPGIGDISTATIGPGSVLTLRFTMRQPCDLRWKFKSEGGDLGFGVARKECGQNIMTKEEVSAYHLNLNSESEEQVSGGTSLGLPEIQINKDINDSEEFKTKNNSTLDIAKEDTSCSFELREEVDEIGSYVENPCSPSQDVVTMERVKSHKELQTGFLHCQAGFTYLLTFDNNHSVFRSKKLMYGVNIQEVDGDLGAENNNGTAGDPSLSVDDLVHFVKDLLELEEEKRTTKENKVRSRNLTPGNTISRSNHSLSTSTTNSALVQTSTDGPSVSVSAVEVHIKP